MQKGIAMRKNLVIAALFGLALAPAGSSPSSASPLGLAATALPSAGALVEPAQYVPGTRGGVAPRGVAPRFVGPGRVGVVPGRVGVPGTFNRNVVINRNIVINRTGAYRGGPWRGGVWVRPRWYRWGPGGAIVAGAAIGFIAATAAYSWAGPPPAPGYCWYYTDPSMQDGFWDICP